MKAALFTTAFVSALVASGSAAPQTTAARAPVPALASPAPMVAAPPAGAGGPSAGPCCVVAAGTLVTIELTEPVSSESKKRGDSFGIKLTAPLIIDGRTVIEAGAEGVGEVVDAAAAGIAGRPAKLVLAARSIDDRGARIPLRAFRLASTGKDRVNGAIVADVLVGVVGLIAVTGGKVVYPAGTRAMAKIAADITVAPLPNPEALAPSQSHQSLSGTQP